MEKKKWLQPRARRASEDSGRRTRTGSSRRSYTDAAGRLLEIDRYCIDAIGVSALRPDLRLLFFIIVHQSASIKEALLDSALSYRAFYNMLDRLKREGLIAVEVDNVDGRVRRIALGGQFDNRMGKMPHF